MAIVRAQRFKPSSSGLLGPGVYLSRDSAKAEHYRQKGGNGGVTMDECLLPVVTLRPKG